MPSEVIVLEVDASSALKAQQATEKGFAATEKRAKQATAAIAETSEQASQQTIRIMDRTKNSIDRIAAQAEKRASQIGKTAIERLESQRAFDLSRVAGDPRAIDRVTNAYSRLIAEQRKASADAAGFGNTLRQALQNPRGALDSLIAGFTGLPGAIGGVTAGIVTLVVSLSKVLRGMGDWAEQLQNTANATGLTRQEVQLLTAAAEDQGVSADIVQQMMKGLAKTMEDTSPKAIALREEFGKMGVQFFNLKGGPQAPLPLLLSISEALSKIEDPMKRIAKAQELFGRAGQEGLKLFNGTLDETIEKLRAAGIVIDEIQLRKMDAMDKRFDEAARKWTTWGNTIKTAIVSVIDAMIQFEAARGRALRGAIAGPEEVKKPGRTEAIASISDFIKEGIQREDVARGSAVVEAFQRRRLQGAPGLQLRLGELTEQRQAALGRIGSGLGEDAARAATAQVEQLDREIASVQASIKALETQRQKAAEAAATALKVREQINLYKAQIHAAAMGAVIEIVKPEAGPGEAFERRIEFDSRQFQQGQRTVPTGSGFRAFGLTTGAASAEMIGTQDELRNLEKVLDTVKKFDADRAQQQVQGIRREGRLQEQLISLRTGPGGEAQAIEETYRLRLEYAQKEFEVYGKTADLLEQTQEAEIDRILDITRLERERFEDIRRSAEGILDELLTRSKSIGDVIQSIFKAAILTPIKQAGATLIANLLAPLYGISRGGGGGAMGTLGGLGAAIPALGGIGSPGAPGGTPGFAGPVGGIGALSQLGGLGGLARGGIGGFGGLTAAGIAPGLLGLAGLGGVGAFKLGQRGGLGKVAGPALGAFSGLLGFGALTAMFPQLAALGPWGFLAAGGIGAFIGIMGALKKSAESKAKEKIKALYGVSINERNILQQITGIAKEMFGGNLDMAIRSQPVRDLVELYAMTMTGSSLGLSKVPQPVSVMQGIGGQITTTPGTRPAVMPMSTAPMTVIMPVQVVGARQFLTEETVNVISRSGRTVQQSSLRAQRSNIGRRETAAVQLAPTMITS